MTIIHSNSEVIVKGNYFLVEYASIEPEQKAYQHSLGSALIQFCDDVQNADHESKRGQVTLHTTIEKAWEVKS